MTTAVRWRLGVIGVVAVGIALCHHRGDRVPPVQTSAFPRPDFCYEVLRCREGTPAGDSGQPCGGVGDECGRASDPPCCNFARCEEQPDEGLSRCILIDRIALGTWASMSPADIVCRKADCNTCVEWEAIWPPYGGD